jgi:anti-anti-sigma factor
MRPVGTLEQRGNRMVLALGGDLDDEERPKLERLLDELAARRPETAVVDLSDVTSVSRVALGALAAGTHRLHEVGCQVIFINPRLVVQALMALLGVPETQLV